VAILGNWDRPPSLFCQPSQSSATFGPRGSAGGGETEGIEGVHANETVPGASILPRAGRHKDASGWRGMAPPKDRKRKFHCRSKAGCATCRKRHVRCDERKPLWYVNKYPFDPCRTGLSRQPSCRAPRG
jgi:hypothetical protein